MKYIEASQLPAEEKVYLKKDILGWRVVHPIRNEDGTLNYFNLIFGSRSNIVFLIVIIFIAVAFWFGVNQLIANYKFIADEPCKFCTDCFEQTRAVLRDMQGSKLTIKYPNFSIS